MLVSPFDETVYAGLKLTAFAVDVSALNKQVTNQYVERFYFRFLNLLLVQMTYLFRTLSPDYGEFIVHATEKTELIFQSKIFKGL